MIKWIERSHWSMPVDENCYVEIANRDKTEIRRGLAKEFNWSYDPDGNNIHFYRVLSCLSIKIEKLQTQVVKVNTSDNEVVNVFPDAETCSLFMVWWHEKGTKEFYDWIDTIE